jgi:hypothetical protein
MGRPAWFRRRTAGWTPCAWPGWLLMGFTVVLLFTLPNWATPCMVLWLVLLLVICFLTDDADR